MAKNIFKLRSPSSAESLVLINFNIGRRRVVYSTGINVPVNLWNAKRYRLKDKITAYPVAEVNRRLEEIDNTVNSKALILKLENRLTVSALRDELCTFFIQNKKLGLHDWLAGYVADITAGKILTASKRVWEAGSIKTVVSTQRILLEYNSSLDWGDLDGAFYEKWLGWLTNYKNYKPSNIVRHFKRLTGLLNVAVDTGACTNLAYKKWKVGSEKASDLSIALTVDEVAEIEALELVGYLAGARDLFLVGVYTGQRFSDYSRIAKGDLSAELGRLNVIQQKTKAKVVVDVTAKLAEILAKYDYTMPTISNQKFNNYIKEVCELCPLLKVQTKIGYTKGGKYKEEMVWRYNMVSSHTARRTFATLAYERNTPLPAIMALTGHKTEKSFMAYIKTSKEKQAEIFGKFR